MAITYVGPIPGAKSGSVSKGVRTYNNELLFESDSQDDDTYHVLTHPLCPRWGQIHPIDPFAYVSNIQAVNHAPWKGWKAVVTWSTERELSEDPTAEPALTEWDGEQFLTPLIVDEDGNLVVNSAGDPFDPPIMRDDSRLVSTTVKLMSSVPTWIMSYADAVNSDAFTIDGFAVAVGQAKMQRPKVSKPQTRNDIAYREVTFTIHYKEDGWLAEPLDVGFREISGTSRIPITDSDGNPVTAPVPLDGSGAELSDPSTTNNVTLSFIQYKRKVFASLPLT